MSQQPCYGSGVQNMAQHRLGMSGQSEWQATQGPYPPDRPPSGGMYSQGHAPDAVYEAHRLFAAYPSASATPSAHGILVSLSLLSALTRRDQ